MSDKAQLGLVLTGEGVVAGVDEAGRGPLAGPVVAAAVILDPARPVRGLRDSKALSDARRVALAERIRERAMAWAIASAEPAEIDALNILAATLLAMRRAVDGLAVVPAHVRVDGNQVPRLDPALGCTVEAIVRGDALCADISAASILAKTWRDSHMRAMHERYPAYGFDRHKGYPTRAHLEALAEHGPCPIHRYTFGPVRAVADPRSP